MLLEFKNAMTRSSCPEVLCKKGVLKIHRKTPATVSFLTKLPQACKICKIFKNIVFYRTPIWLLLDEYRNYWVLVNTSWICL